MTKDHDDQNDIENGNIQVQPSEFDELFESAQSAAPSEKSLENWKHALNQEEALFHQKFSQMKNEQTPALKRISTLRPWLSSLALLTAGLCVGFFTATYMQTKEKSSGEKNAENLSLEDATIVRVIAKY